MRYFERNGNSLIWRNRNETLEISPWGRDSLRVRSTLVGEIIDTRWALLDPEDVEPEIVTEDMHGSITVGKIKADVTVDTWHRYATISFYNQRNELLLRETGTAGSLDLKSRKFEPHLGGDFSLTATFEGHDGEHIYGMGQYQEEVVDWKGSSLELAHRNSQASVPFYISSLGYGFLWHNPAIGEVTFGVNRTTWRAESTKQLDYFITAGDTPADISRNYAKATGFAPEMPEYGIGFWQCKLRYWNQEQVLEVAREHKRRGLPMDVIVVDFFHWPKMGDYRFDYEFFPDPAAMAKELDEMGIKLMVSVWPQVSLRSENYQEMLQQGLLVRAEYGEQIGMDFVEDSMFYDATNPRAREYVWEKCRKNYWDMGVRLFWLDEAEPEYGVYDFKNYRYYLGSNQQVGNIYPQLYAKGFYDGMRSVGTENPLSLVRCAWAGSQRYGALVWSGDISSEWADFRRQICAGLSMGLAGIPWWTTDIGGFCDGINETPEFHELLIRWFQWGCYCPVMRIHGHRLPNSDVLRANGEKVLYTGADNEVWSYGEEVYDVMVKYLGRREELRPYIREMMHLAHTDGTPIMRTMAYEFPDDESMADIKYQYMFGDRYLVAPVIVAGDRTKQIALPAGTRWQDVDTGEVYEGGQTVTVPAPLERIPVLERKDV